MTTTNNNTDSNEQQDDSLLCEWCAKGDKADFLDSDGTRVSITGNNGVLSHAYDVYWWPCLRFGVELHSSRASLAAVPNHALVQLLESGLLHPESAEGNIRQVIEMLNAAVSSPLPAEPPPCAKHCKHDMRYMTGDPSQITERRVWCTHEDADGFCGHACAPAEPRQEGEQERWTSDGCGLFRNGAWVTSTAVPEVAASLARKLNQRTAETPVVAREIAREWMNTHHASFETNQQREDALIAIITRRFAASASLVNVGPRICLKCGHEERFSDNEYGYCEKIVDEEAHFCGCVCRFAAPVVATDNVEGETLRTMASSIFADYEPGSKAYSFGLRVVEYLRHENETNR